MIRLSKKLALPPFFFDSVQSTYLSTPHSPRSKNAEKSSLFGSLMVISLFENNYEKGVLKQKKILTVSKVCYMQTYLTLH